MNDIKTYPQTIEMLAQWKYQMRTSDGKVRELDQHTLAVISFIYNVGEREIIKSVNAKVDSLIRNKR